MVALSSNPMVDIHNHLLPGLDDGAKDLKTSVDMARMAVRDGLTHMICTPHASGTYAFSPETIAERLALLRAALEEHGIALTLSTGCDFHFSYDNLKDAAANPKKYSLGGSEYILIELPDHGLPPTINEAFYELRLAGLTPILTHPERNATIVRKPELLVPWLRDGLLLQVTANSVTNGMGSQAYKLAHELLKKRWVHFLATDAHNTGSRPPVLSEAREAVAKKYGQRYADLLTIGNPTAVMQGKPLPQQEEPIGLEEDFDSGLPWYQKIFRSKMKS